MLQFTSTPTAIAAATARRDGVQTNTSAKLLPCHVLHRPAFKSGHCLGIEGITTDLFWQAREHNLAQVAVVVETSGWLFNYPKLFRYPIPSSQSRVVIPSGLEPGFHPQLKSFSPNSLLILL